MISRRRKVLRRLAATAAAVSSALSVSVTLGLMSTPAYAQSATGFPNRPVKLIVPFAAGSGTDIGARILAEELTKVFGQNVLVENRPGASAQIAAEAVAKSPPDGYTLFFTTNTSHSANPFLFKKLPYDPVKDFSPVALMYYLPFILVVDPKLPIQNVNDFITYLKANPGKVSYAYGNSTGQVAGAAVAQTLKMPMTAVPYKSTPPAMTDIIGGVVPFMFVDLASSSENVKSGRLRAIAATTGKRSTLMPELPALAEAPALAGFDLTSWGGVFAPAGTPTDVVARLSTSIQGVLERKDIRQRFAGLGFDVTVAGPDGLASFVREQLDNWGKKIHEAGIQPE